MNEEQTCLITWKTRKGEKKEYLPRRKHPALTADGKREVEALAEEDGKHPGRVFIYTLTDPRTGFVRYVGKTVHLITRYFTHLNARRTSHSAAWIRSLFDVGLRPVMEIIDWVDDSAWKESESFYIRYFRFLGFDLTNLTAGGEGSVGYKHPEHIRKKMSAIAKGKPKGPQSAEHKEKRRLANLGGGGWKLPPRTEEYRKNISFRNKGRKFSDATKLKMSLARKGKKLSESHKASIKAGLLRRFANRNQYAEQ